MKTLMLKKSNRSQTFATVNLSNNSIFVLMPKKKKKKLTSRKIKALSDSRKKYFCVFPSIFLSFRLFHIGRTSDIDFVLLVCTSTIEPHQPHKPKPN